ncbi:MAG TPA: hypothetical protein VF502_10375 [Stellaceae bacterium]
MRAPLLLSALCAVLLGIVYVELDQPAIEAPAKAAVPPTRGTDKGQAQKPGFAMPPLRSFGDVLARPLFAETRRPPILSVPADARSSAFTLVGIVISARERHALVEHGQPPRVERIAEGQDIDGWTVEKILPDRVMLGRADARIEVKAKDAPARPGPPRRAGAAITTVTPADTNPAVFGGVQLGAAPDRGTR